ncbi:hypothetical protein AWV80_19345 [Cupriavidus sp. UYMU48A]|nr:hypothetical protein AWV80_19345 [Cupriavidus sp. UYMU48A]
MSFSWDEHGDITAAHGVDADGTMHDLYITRSPGPTQTRLKLATFLLEFFANRQRYFSVQLIVRIYGQTLVSVGITAWKDSGIPSLGPIGSSKWATYDFSIVEGNIKVQWTENGRTFKRVQPVDTTGQPWSQLVANSQPVGYPAMNVLFADELTRATYWEPMLTGFADQLAIDGGELQGYQPL